MSHCLEIQVARCPPQTAGRRSRGRSLLHSLPVEEPRPLLASLVPRGDAGAAPGPALGAEEPGPLLSPRRFEAAPRPALPAEMPKPILSSLPAEVPRPLLAPFSSLSPRRCGAGEQPAHPAALRQRASACGAGPGGGICGSWVHLCPPAREREGKGAVVTAAPQNSLSSCFLAAALVACREQNQGPLRAPSSRQLGKGSFGFSRCQRLLFLSTALI